MKENTLIYLDSYTLQQDLRIRLPKSVLINMKATKGKTMFDIYLNSEENSLVLKISEKKGEKNEK